jgi:hypothetical protein
MRYGTRFTLLVALPAVHIQAAAGVDMIKVYSRLESDVFMAMGRYPECAAN